MSSCSYDTWLGKINSGNVYSYSYQNEDVNSRQPLLSYVMWNLFTVGSLQFCNDSAIASLEANQTRPKIKNFGNK